MVCTVRYKHGLDHYLSGMNALVSPRKSNGHVHVYIGRYKLSRFKNNTFIIILKHFEK